MAKNELKTKETKASVEEFFNQIEDEKIRTDCKKIAEIMEKATAAKPKMWGTNIVGFGERLLKYESGRELDWMEIGFSPRKANLTLYLTNGELMDEESLSKLGKYKLGKGCLYFKRLSDVDEKVLEKLIEKSVENIRRK
ncbi:MAG TPA: DUF1801 domain-containing protein [Pyrinomonadaceae bacterium]|nr:DUF1801 domain-containing protein [Pyrinomonadaceae bacterium]